MNPVELIESRLTGSTQKALAKELGVSLAYLHDVLRRRKEPGPKILRGLGVRRVVTYEFTSGRR